MQLKLEDLNPQEATFKLSAKPDKTFVLRKFTLASRIWLRGRFGEDVKGIFEQQKLAELAEIAHYLLKDKKEFPTFMDFAECIVTVPDQVALTKSLMLTIGIDDAMIKSLNEKMGNEKASSPTT